MTSGLRLAMWVDGSRWTSSMRRLNSGSFQGSWLPVTQGPDGAFGGLDPGQCMA